MGLGTKATDWQVCGVADTAGGDVIGAGLFVFDFYSSSAEITGRCVFKGVGIGAGGNVGGTALGGDIGPYTSFSAIEVRTAFSMRDLDRAWGRVASFGVGLGLGYSILAITAAPPWTWEDDKHYFLAQNVGGFGTGLGAGGVLIGGTWAFKQVVANKPGSPYDAYA